MDAGIPHRLRSSARFDDAGLFLQVFLKKLLTNACVSCNIIQVAARHRPGKKILLDWKRLAGADASDKKKNKKVLDSLKEMRYNK